jgi:hypothetical protein
MQQDRTHHNLHSGRVSVCHAAGRCGQEQGKRLVTLTADWVEIVGATPRVSEATWKRSRTAGRNGNPKRSVHAWVFGTVVNSGSGTPDINGLQRVRYNPSRHAPGSAPVFHFDNGSEWTGSGRCIVTGGYIYAS